MSSFLSNQPFHSSFLIVVVLSLTLPSCKHLGLEPTNLGIDTTSHAFSWSLDTLGSGNASILRDVSIINEDNIWAVGEIFLMDSTGQFDPNLYNVARWDGNRWRVLRISFPQYDINCAIVYYGASPIYSVFGYDANNIFFLNGLSVARWNGTSFAHYPCLSHGIVGSARFRRVFGVSGNTFYCAGTEGMIYYFNGTSWQQQSSGTTVDLWDLWGSGSSVWACGYRSNYSESVLLHYDGSGWETIWKTSSPQDQQPYNGLLASVWGPDGDSLIVAGGEGVYRQKFDGMGKARKEQLSIGSFPERVRGQWPNDIAVVGDNGMVWHFNGVNWKTYSELSNSYHVYYSVAIKGDIIVAVGADYSNPIERKALVAVGRR